MPIALIIMMNDSVVITFAAFLISIKKGFHHISGEIITIIFGVAYSIFWYYCYSFFVGEVYKMHWKYSKYNSKWYNIVNWGDVLTCRGCSSIGRAFCPKSKEKKSETENVAKEIKIIKSMEGFVSSIMTKKGSAKLTIAEYAKSNQVADRDKMAEHVPAKLIEMEQLRR